MKKTLLFFALLFAGASSNVQASPFDLLSRIPKALQSQAWNGASSLTGGLGLISLLAGGSAALGKRSESQSAQILSWICEEGLTGKDLKGTIGNSDSMALVFGIIMMVISLISHTQANK